MLYPLMGSMMSHPERKYRDAATPPMLFALKDSIHSIFLRAEQLVKQGQHDTFVSIAVASASNRSSSTHIIIWLDAVRWMEEQNNVVYDVAYCTLEPSFVEDVTKWTFKICNNKFLPLVRQENIVQLWRDQYLPLCASRVAASYHPPSSSFSSSSTSVSSNGVPLPARFLALPGANRIARYFTRAALFPLFPPQGVSILTDSLTKKLQDSLMV